MKISLKTPSIDNRSEGKFVLLSIIYSFHLDRKLNLFKIIKSKRERDRRQGKRYQGPKTLEIPGFSKKKPKKNSRPQMDSATVKRSLWNVKAQPKILEKHQVIKAILPHEKEDDQSDEMLNSTAEFYKPPTGEGMRNGNQEGRRKEKEDEIKIISRVQSENKEGFNTKPKLSSRIDSEVYGSRYKQTKEAHEKFQMYNPQSRNYKKL